MKKRFARRYLLLCWALIGLTGLLPMGLAQAQQFKVLVFTKTQGYHHQSIADGVLALRELAAAHHFALDWQQDAEVLNDENLKQFQALVFLSTTGSILNEAQKAALQRFVRAGKGFVGIHSAADTEHGWDWYGRLIGRRFVIHPEIQTGTLLALNRRFPGLEALPERSPWTDEWYQFGPENLTGLNYLLAVDESSFDARADWGGGKTGSGMGKFHPIAWQHEFEGGRVFYTGLGHTAAVYKSALFLAHVYGGLYWAATGRGIKPAP